MAPWNWGNRRKAIIGSAAQITIEGYKVRNAPPRQDWQDRAWEHIDSIGELGFAVNFISNALSRMDLFPAEKPEQAGDTPVPTEISKALDVFASLDEGYNGGTSSLMGALGQHFPSVGEGHLIGFDEQPKELIDGKPAPIRSNYEVLSISELDVKPEGYRRKNEPGAPWDDLPKDTYALRVWRRHPRWSNLAWSPMKPLDTLCHELILRTDSDTAAARSRIANSGILPVPEELEFPAAPDAPDGVDEFTWALVQHMSTAIGDPSHASAVVPLVVRGKAAILAEWAKAGVIKLGRDPDEKDMERRKAIIERIAAGIDLPAEVLLGMGSMNHWCMDSATEALTKDRGFVTHDALKIGDEVLTLNPTTGLSEWQPVQNIYRADVVNEPMISMDTQNHSSLSTANHRWLTTRKWNLEPTFRTSRKLSSADWIPSAATCNDLPKVAKWDDDFVELVAWIWAEGHIAKHALSIAQSHTKNPAKVARLRACLVNLFGESKDMRSDEPTWREGIQKNTSSYGGPITVFYLNRLARRPFVEQMPNKHIRFDFISSLTKAQLELFIEVCCLGDGRHRYGRDIWQKEPSRLDAIEFALVLSGRMVMRTEEGKQLSWSTTRSRVRPIKAAQHSSASTHELKRYSGIVWCPTTANGTWFARRRGTVFFTGNSLWGVQQETFESHIEPFVILALSSLTTGWYRPALQSLGMSVQESRNHLMWFDPSRLVVPADRTKDANEALDRGAIGFRAYRDAGGWSEDDAPTEEDLALMERINKSRPAPTPPTDARDIEPGPPAEGEPASNGAGVRVKR